MLKLNITLVLAELLNQKDSLYWIEDLAEQLTAANTVDFLMDHIFTGSPGVPPAMSLLTTVILHTEKEDAAKLDEPVVAEDATPTPQTTLGSVSSEWMERYRTMLMKEVALKRPPTNQWSCLCLKKRSRLLEERPWR